MGFSRRKGREYWSGLEGRGGERWVLSRRRERENKIWSGELRVAPFPHLSLL